MSATRDFHLGDILTITTGRLVAPRLIEAVYDILNFMTSESLYTHQLGRGMKECGPELLRQHPQLAEIVVPELTAESWRGWLAEQATRFGETLPVAPLAKREAKYDTPVGDLVEMLGGNTDKIVVVEL